MLRKSKESLWGTLYPLRLWSEERGCKHSTFLGRSLLLQGLQISHQRTRIKHTV